jgi:topoisomerase-4 subunit A
VALKPMSKLKKLSFDVDFAETSIKGRASQGNILTKYAVKKISLKSKGVSTLAGRKIWYDPITKRLNENGHGRYLGEFQAEDKILCVFNDGSYELSSFDLSNHFDDKMLRIEKLYSQKVFSCIHFDGKSKNYFIKRFVFEDLAIGKRNGFISEEPNSKMVLLSSEDHPIVKIESLKGKSQLFDEQEIDLSEAIDVKGIKAQGNKLSQNDVQKVELMSELNDNVEEQEDEDDKDETEISDDDLKLSEEEDSIKLEISKEEKEAEIKIEKAEEDREVIKPEESKPKFTSTPKPERKIDFEITNPDDIKLDDKGQTKLF